MEKKINEYVNILIKNGMPKKDIVVLHCHTNYPTQLKEVNLLAMKSMEKKFKINVGYSDHTIGDEVSIAAVALGAKIIEKHFTINPKLRESDNPFSIDEQELEEILFLIKKSEKILGYN